MTKRKVCLYQGQLYNPRNPGVMYVDIDTETLDMPYVLHVHYREMPRFKNGCRKDGHVILALQEASELYTFRKGNVSGRFERKMKKTPGGRNPE